ncbi:MAG: GNAT family N-acetyltransferase, partial [Anaerolineae bacterium]
GEYIRNVHNTQLTVARSGGLLLPVSITDFHPDNTYTCSPYSHYISYGGFEEVERLHNRPLEALIRLILRPVAWYFRSAELDKAALVNNWLLSTNLYPDLKAAEIEPVIKCLPEWFPDRAIVFRSVDANKNPLLFEMLQTHGYEMIFSRQVWYQEPSQAVRTAQFREDVRRVRRNGHQAAEGFREGDIERVLELYGLLYLRKYSYFNPQFTPLFLQLALERGLLRFRVVRGDGIINGALGYFVRNGTMTCPLFGYDTNLPQQIGLYRMLSVEAMREALKHGWLLHASAGVGKFKKARGGKSIIEYNAVYTQHLPAYRQLPWKALRQIANAAIPIVQKNQL